MRNGGTNGRGLMGKKSILARWNFGVVTFAKKNTGKNLVGTSYHSKPKYPEDMRPKLQQTKNDGCRWWGGMWVWWTLFGIT